jgi:hypothetical protein
MNEAPASMIDSMLAAVDDAACDETKIGFNIMIAGIAGGSSLDQASPRFKKLMADIISARKRARDIITASKGDPING